MAFKTDESELETVIRRVRDSELVLADFQRDYAWKPGQVKKLLHSICMGYPIGSILLSKKGAGGLEGRGVELQSTDEHKVTHLILDGQQRLTSLFHLVYQPLGIKHRYFFELKKLPETITEETAHSDIEACIKIVPIASRGKGGEEHANHSDPVFLVRNCIFPASKLFELSDAKDSIVSEATNETLPEGKRASKAEADEFVKRWRILKGAVYDHTKHYKIPCTALDERTSLNAVSRIFETINNTGLRLTLFDLLVAKIARSELKLRKKWDEMITDADYAVLTEFEIDEEEFIETLYLLCRPNAKSFSTDEILTLTKAEIESWWELTADGFVAAIEYLKDIGVFSRKKLLPYGPMLVPLAALHALAFGKVNGKAKKIDSSGREKFRSKASCWFWRCVFSEEYVEGASTLRISHLSGLKKYCLEGKKWDEVEEFRSLLSLNVGDIKLQSQLPGSAIYKGCLALGLMNGMIDFHTGERITAAHISKLQDHHIFPQKFLTAGIVDSEKDRAIINCICNRSYIDEHTNKSIGKKDPRIYIGEMAEERTRKQVEDRLESHLIRTSNLTFLSEAFEKKPSEMTVVTKDLFLSFLADREKALKSLVERSIEIPS
jgi:hypothetical protein